MRLSDEEAKKELESLEKVLGMLRARRRVLREQAALQGIGVDPKIIIEIEDLENQIQRNENQVDQLQTQAVEVDLTLAEANYSSRLANAWGRGRGSPSVDAVAYLELNRLQLQLPLERAHELEQQVRKDLAEERLFGMLKMTSFETMHHINDAPAKYHDLAFHLNDLILLHAETVIDLFLAYECNWGDEELQFFLEGLLKDRTIPYQRRYRPIFEQFIEMLRAELIESRKNAPAGGIYGELKTTDQ